MKIPLTAFIQKNEEEGNEKLLIYSNGNQIKIDLPFSPFILAEANKFPELTGNTETWTKVPQHTPTDYFRINFRTNKEYYDVIKKYSDRKRYIFNNNYIDQLLISHPDYFLNYPNTNNLKIMYFDIEVVTRGDGYFPRPITNEVLCIGYSIWEYNNIGEKRKIKQDIIKGFNENTKDSNILTNFKQVIINEDPDIIAGYNSESFDFPYLIDRFELMKIDTNGIGRNNRKIYKYKNQIIIPGRIHFDIYNSNAGVTKDQTLCYDQNTEILTENGWKYFNKLLSTEKVATLNQTKNELEYQLPTKIHSYDYSGKMYRVKAKSVDLLVTENHDMYVEYKEDKDKPKWVFKKPNEILNKKYKVKRNVENWNGNNRKTFSIPKIIRKKMEYNYKNKNTFKIEDWLEFFGYYISEGSCYIHEKKGLYNINISQCLKYSNNVNKIRDCIKRLGFSTNYYSNNDSSGNINFKGKQLCQYLKQFGYANEKYIPQKILNLNKRLLKILFDALMLGDGTKAKKKDNGYITTAAYTTTSKKLSDNIQEIGIKLGYAVSESKEIHYYGDRKSTTYRIRLIERQVNPTINSKKIQDEIINYRGKVYCCTVPNNIIMVRRNGYSLWCGNSGIKSKSLKDLARFYKVNIEDIELPDEISNLYKLYQENPEKLYSYQNDDVLRTEHVGNVYIRNCITLAEMMGCPLDSIVTMFSSFIPKLIMAREMESLRLINTETNFQKYNSVNGSICQFRKFDGKELKYQGALTGIYKVGFFDNVHKLDFKCVDNQTQLLTRDGWTYVDKITGNEDILTWNKESNNFVFEKINKWNVYDYSGELININNKYIDQMITPNHRVIHKNTRKDKEWKIKEADSLSTYIKIPLSAFYISNNKVNDKYAKIVKIIPWIITEGNIRDSDIVISQRYTVNKKYCDEIERILSEYDETQVKITKRKNRPDKEYRIKNELFKLIKESLTYTYRRLPIWLYDLPILERRDFIASLISGDGHKYTEKHPGVYVSKDEELIDDIQLLAHLSGLRAIKSKKCIDNRNGSKWFYLHITGATDTFYTCNKKRPTKNELYKRVQYKGKVYCPSVNNETFLMRRNGKISITGNSMYPSSIQTWNIGPDTTSLVEVRPYTGKYRFSSDSKYNWYSIPDANFNVDIIIKIRNDKDGFLKTKISTLKSTRVKIKKEIKNCPSDQKEAKHSQQNAIKVILNSIYGYFGLNTSIYGDMISGAAVTGMCRWTTTNVMQWLADDLVETDSVVGDTPIYVRDKHSGDINIIPIEDLHRSNLKRKKYSGNYEILTRNGWKNIKYTKKHSVKKDIHRVKISDGYVDVTSDHSLFTTNKKEVAPKNIIVNTTNIETIYNPITNSILPKFDNEFCWLLGFLIAEGSVYEGYTKTGKEKRQVSFNGNNIELMRRVEYLSNKYFNKPEFGNSKFRLHNTMSSSAVYKVQGGYNKIICDWLKENCYTLNRKDKKIPIFILNGTNNMKSSFLDGIMIGDGYNVITKDNRKIESLDSKFKSLSAGIRYLWNSLGHKTICVVRSDKLNITTYRKRVEYKSGKLRNINTNIVLQNNIISKSETVYDVSTDDGTFVTALGNIVLHNTDGLILDKPVDESKINEDIDKMIKDRFGFKENYMEMELENFGRAFFYKTKNYVVEEDGKYIKHGVSMKSSKVAKVIDRAVDLAIEHWFNNKPIEEVIREAYNFKNLGLEWFEERVKLSKEQIEYDDQTDMKLLLAKQMEMKTGQICEKGMQISYFVTKDQLPFKELRDYYKKTSIWNYTFSKYVESIKDLNLAYYEKMIDKALDRFDIYRIEQTDFLSQLDIKKKSKVELDTIPMEKV